MSQTSVHIKSLLLLNIYIYCNYVCHHNSHDFYYLLLACFLSLLGHSENIYNLKCICMNFCHHINITVGSNYWERATKDQRLHLCCKLWSIKYYCHKLFFVQYLWEFSKYVICILMGMTWDINGKYGHCYGQTSKNTGNKYNLKIWSELFLGTMTCF